MAGLLQDVKFGLRMMAQNPWFTVIAVLTMALGIGVSSVGFSIANGVWWKKLPFANPQEVVALVMSDGSVSPDLANMSQPELADIRSRAKSYKAMAAVASTYVVLTNDGATSERYAGAHVTSNLFSFLGIKPIRGRDFGPDDEKPGAPKVVLISHEIWQTRYGGSENTVGQVVRVDTAPGTIIGIMPPGFRFPFNQKIWTPLIPSGNEPRDNRVLDVFARLGDGVSIQQARAEAVGIGQAFARDYPDTNKEFDAVVLSFMNWVNGPAENAPVLLLFGAMGFVLLIACGNVANLLLSRVVQRSREVSVRAALGASRWRIIRQILVESVMLSLLGGAVGLVFAEVGIRWIHYVIAGIRDLSGMPYWITFEMDTRVLIYVVAICIATGVGFGSLPAFQISRTNVGDALKEGARHMTGGFRARRTATVLLVAEIAMTVVLFQEAGLFMNGFLSATRVPLGIDTQHLVTAGLQLPPRYFKDADRITLVESLMERLNRPGRFATVALSTPLGGSLQRQLKLQDREIADKTGKLLAVGTLPVDKGYFPTLDVKVVRGRDFQAGDGRPGASVAIVNERFASVYWPNENPVGKRLRLGDEKAPWLEVIGVSPDIFQTGKAASGPDPIVYVPYRQNPTAILTVLVRSTETQAALAAMRTELANIDRDLALDDVATFDESLRLSLWGERFFGILFAALSVMALVMSSVGLYGVTAHGVNQRTREIGIRAALGATRLRLVGMFLKQSLIRIVPGLIIGLLGAVSFADLSTAVLEVGEKSSVTFFGISGLLAAVTVAATLLPAWRASKLNPSDALRSE